MSKFHETWPNIDRTYKYTPGTLLTYIFLYFTNPNHFFKIIFIWVSNLHSLNFTNSFSFDKYMQLYTLRKISITQESSFMPLDRHFLLAINPPGAPIDLLTVTMFLQFFKFYRNSIVYNLFFGLTFHFA